MVLVYIAMSMPMIHRHTVAVYRWRHWRFKFKRARWRELTMFQLGCTQLTAAHPDEDELL